ncbi:MAG: hypothetical protein LBD01_06120 [Puniceicoccales bacterium]|nr:hypothetical protein [Puniceicoccales bacterium]
MALCNLPVRMIWFYRLLFLPVLWVAAPYYLLRMLRRGGYGRDFSHRLGAIGPLSPKAPGKHRIWFQAVSVGEVKAIEPLLRQLAAQGETELVLTTTTSTAYAIVRERLAPFLCASGIFPLDFAPFSHRAWERIQPDSIVLMEGELWPEHLHQARKRQVPVSLINARLSDQSFRRYCFAPVISRHIFSLLSSIGVAAAEDAQRFTQLGVPPGRIRVTGNLKVDAAIGISNGAEDLGKLHASLGFSDAVDAPILLGSSTWHGEEAMLLDVLARARAAGISLRLLLVPRHAERRAQVAALLKGTPWRWFLRSVHPVAPHPADVCVADTTGELSQLAQLASVAFVGKSLPPHSGGQSPIECAACRVPVVYGPRMDNFRDICRSLETAGIAFRASNAEEAKQLLLTLLEDKQRRLCLGEDAHRWLIANQGATDRTLNLLKETTRGNAA